MIVSREETLQASRRSQAETPSPVDDAKIRLEQGDLIRETVARVADLPDREALVEEMKARIAKGEYVHSGDEIGDAMARRTLADRVR